MLRDEQMNQTIAIFSIIFPELNDEEMSNWLGVKHLPVSVFVSLIYLTIQHHWVHHIPHHQILEPFWFPKATFFQEK